MVKLPLLLSSNSASIFINPPMARTPFVLFKHHPPISLKHPFLQSHHKTFYHASNYLRIITSLYNNQQQQPPRTLFPGGYKRPEIKVPNIVLQVGPEEVLGGGDVLDLIDVALSKSVGIVVLNGDEGVGGGGRLYEAAVLLKSMVRDRAYLMVAERVDIAAAVNANGVVLSDQGLPTIVARNTMMDSRSESVVLPLIARKVHSLNAALNASNSEGADFLLYGVDEDTNMEVLMNSTFGKAKIPIFVAMSFYSEDAFPGEALKLLRSGASGFVVSMAELRLFDEDALSSLFRSASATSKRTVDILESTNDVKILNVNNGSQRRKGVAGFVDLDEKERLFIEREREVLLEVVNVVRRAAPLMEELSLLTDAISQLNEPFMLVIVGEFNSGKSSVINALLGSRYLKEGVVPTTNEITFLRYSELVSDEIQRCERHPDGQYICYLPAPILKDMNIVDTPGTNVILQRQQRLTEEFVPRADLLLFVMSADRPLTESEVSFLRYTQQWKKKVVFVLNKSDLYQTASELEEAMSFIRENAQNLLKTEDVVLYPVSARSALEAKLSASRKDGREIVVSNLKHNSFYELENFLYSFLDGTTATGMERIKLKLETPIGIAERLLSACQTLVRQDCRYAKQDLTSVNEIIDSVEEYAMEMENESISWKRQTLSLIESAKARVVKLIESTLKLSNVDLIAFIFSGERSASVPAATRVQNDIVGPALNDVQGILGEYVSWLQSNNARKGKLYKEIFDKRWPAINNRSNEVRIDSYELLSKADELSMRAIEQFSATAASKLFVQEVREVSLGTFGGLGAAGLSASLLTSVLPTTLEDLLALGLCSAGGYLAISNFPSRRQKMVDKINRTADALARQLEEAMQKDLSESISNLQTFVKLIGKPYREAAEQRLERLVETQDQLTKVEKELRKLQIEVQNLHLSS